MDGAEETTAGAALFARLGALGVDYVFCNSGTDFPPIIEGLARSQRAARAAGARLPRAILCPHEHAAVGMAHGVWFATGRAQAVMLHTNVGLANGAIGAINAATDHVPMLLMSGRTPTLEAGRFGARTVPIGWGQEMRDQAALVREACKWEYELRFPEQVQEVADRGWAIAESTPKGPVYLALPREVLCEAVEAARLGEGPAMAPALGAPPVAEVERLADWIAEADRPLLISQRGPGSDAAFEALTEVCEGWGIPVCHWWANAIAIPTTSPMEVGADPAPWLGEADLVIVLDALAPWMPESHQPDQGARVVHIGPSPLHARTPVRNFRSDLSLAGETAETVRMLAEALARRGPGARAAQRIVEISQRTMKIKETQRVAARSGGSGAMSKAFVSACLAEAMAAHGGRTTVISELGAPLAGLPVTHRNGWRQEPHSGGLGWGLPCAMGVALAEPDTLVFATMGDGSYVFANPVACHQAMEALGLPLVILVLNNAEWGAVRASVKGLYPQGVAAKANEMPLTSLSPSPDFAAVAGASRAWARRVEDGADLPAALAEAARVATVERRCALLDLNVARD